jgi:hypothetical protein
MTEQEWLASTDPEGDFGKGWPVDAAPLMDFLRGRASKRKLRLLALACFRCLGSFAEDLTLAERHADGQATAEELKSFEDWVSIWVDDPGLHRADQESIRLQHAATLGDPLSVIYSSFYPASGRSGACALVRDVLGNPFRPVAVRPDWLAWNDGTVPRMARAIYEGRQLPRGTLDNTRLAVLADALEEAGCNDRDILDHCRIRGEHVLGCWVVDLLSGKQ